MFDKNAYKKALTPIHKKFTIDKIEYHWFGGLGSIFYSVERKKIPVGSVRIIANIPFYVFSIERKGLFHHTIHWTNSLNDVEWIREFKNWIFS